MDFKLLHLEYMTEGGEHSGIIVTPQKNAYEIVQRVAVLLNTLTADEVANQLLYV